MSYMFHFADTLIRPFTEEKSSSKIYNLLMLLMILLTPFFLIGAYFENKLLISQISSLWNNIIVSYIGFCTYLLGGLLTIVARTQLGRFGTAELITEEDHQLFTQGVYRYIRNPMYTGSIIAMVGFCLIFRCLIFLVIIFSFYFLGLRMRILEEERILTEKFGAKYEEYKKRTKRLFPFIY
ncbi:MAG: methyltransferase family protein [Candidatus Thorarchaeota archaeon]